jgi:hypothetical protein
MLSGDQVSRRGPMTGGYIDVKRSKLELSRRRKELYAERETISVRVSMSILVPIYSL